MTKRTFLLTFLAGAPLAVLTGCNDACCDDRKRLGGPTSSTRRESKPSAVPGAPSSRAAEPVVRLAADEPVDARFSACALSCSAGLFSDKRKAVPQPGARVGDVAFCVVSGAVFDVTGASPRRELAARTLFFCCEACAGYFSQHRQDVLAARCLGALDS
jgi:hypothetical protein